MVSRYLLVITCLAMVAFAGLSVACDGNASAREAAPEITLSQETVDQAIALCSDSEDWSATLGAVRTSYRRDSKITAYWVLHNGNDAERLVRLSLLPTSKQTVDGEMLNQRLREDEGMTSDQISNMDRDERLALAAKYRLDYNPTPYQALEWVDVDVGDIRMDEMETLAVPISFSIPSDYNGRLPDRWEFRVTAQGLNIREYQLRTIVTSVEDDTTLQIHLPFPPLYGVDSIMSIESEIDESPRALAYSEGSGILTIVDLAENAVREMIVTYEYGENVALGYSQRWLITMLPPITAYSWIVPAVVSASIGTTILIWYLISKRRARRREHDPYSLR